MGKSPVWWIRVQTTCRFLKVGDHGLRQPHLSSRGRAGLWPDLGCKNHRMWKGRMPPRRGWNEGLRLEREDMKTTGGWWVRAVQRSHTWAENQKWVGWVGWLSLEWKDGKRWVKRSPLSFQLSQCLHLLPLSDAANYRLPKTGFNKKLLPRGRNPMVRDVHFTTPSKHSTESPR